MRQRIMLVLCAAGVFATLAFSQGYTPIQAFPNLTFNNPIFLTHSPDGTNRVFAVQQNGLIYVFQNDSAVTASSLSIFLNVGNRLGSSTGEQGLLGMAFHPDYANNGYFYLNYSAGSPRRTVVGRFSVIPGQPNKADSLSFLSIIEIGQDFSNHNGGMIAFGNDGMLYIGMGDGGSSNDPNNRAQDSTQLLGKMLRIDVDNVSPPLNYGIPADNPFASGFGPNVRKEIWALGMRNPWRWSFDNVTGQLWAGDVGQVDREEIDLIEGGKNYGWRIMEGMICNPFYGSCNPAGLTLPIKDYPRSLGATVTGGYVYRGHRRPELYGAYIYADYISGRIWKLRYVNGTITEDSLLYDASYSISSFGVDENNELYIVRYSSTSGGIYRFAGQPFNPNPTTVVMAPNGGEVWTGGSLREIRWYPANVDSVNLSYRISETEPWVSITNAIPAASGSFLWSVPHLNTTEARVRITTSDTSVSDISNNVFTIASAVLQTSSDTVDLGGAFTGTSVSDTLVVSNTGLASLSVTSLTIDSAGFTALPSTLSIAPGASANLIITFMPTEVRGYSATLQLNSNDPTSPTSVALRGHGLLPVGIDGGDVIPREFSLSQNYPNPFNPATVIRYAVPQTHVVTIKVFDMLGREVATLVNDVQEPGYKEIQFNSSSFSSGVYYYTMTAGSFVETKKMILVR